MLGPSTHTICDTKNSMSLSVAGKECIVPTVAKDGDRCILVRRPCILRTMGERRGEEEEDKGKGKGKE